MRKGDSRNFRKGWGRWFSMPWAFKLNHLQPFKPILFPNFSNILTFILGSPILLPQRANNEKRQFSQLQKRMSLIHFCVWKNSLFPLLALWGNKNWPPSMKVQKMQIFLNKMGWKGCKWFSLNAPGTESLEPIPIVEPILVMELIPVVDPIPLVPILALCELITIPIPIPKKMESQQR